LLTNLPIPSSNRVSRQMSAQRSHDTGIELALRRDLHRRGLRYRVHQRPIKHVNREVDIVFGPAKVAVFVDGCFWHRCPVHKTIPASNNEWWKAKLQRNHSRDLETNRILQESGWVVIRIWEHEDVRQSADQIQATVRQRLHNSASRRN
jgi:DNA mismatch endonuclease (patch repair protein)